MATLLKYLSVYLLSGLKFIFGPALGIIAYELPIIAVIVLTSCGMMTTVYLLTFLGENIRKFLKRSKWKNKKASVRRSRRFLKIWNKYGLKGVCFLTPLILTPPVGGLLVNIVVSDKSLIIKWMWISALFWSVVISILAKYVEGLRTLIYSSAV